MTGPSDAVSGNHLGTLRPSAILTLIACSSPLGDTIIQDVEEQAIPTCPLSRL
jgi:hypothetical protein